MPSTTIDTINRLANERIQLWWLAGHRGLTPKASLRLGEITATLPQLWHERRCELVGCGVLL